MHTPASTQKTITKFVTGAFLSVTVAVGSLLGFSGRAFAAACTPPGTDYGTVTTSVTVPASATYRLWTRMNVPDATNNTYLLEVDGSKCFTVGGGSIGANAWVWISFQNGNSSSRTDATLTQGTHTLKLIGNKPNVKVDRIVLTSDLNCTPTSTSGSECNTSSDTTPPTVRITAPIADSAVSGTVPVQVSATDGAGVTKVELYVNGSLIGTDTTSPYSFSWNSTAAPNGTELLTAKGYDASGNVGTDSFNVSVQNGDREPPAAPTGLTATAPAYNKVVLNWKAATDNTGVKSYTVIRDSVPIANIGNVTTYTDTPVSANTEYTYQVMAVDAAGNKSAWSAKATIKTPNVADSQAPAAPAHVTATAVSPTQVNVGWEAATDNIGVTAYDVYRAIGNNDATKIATVTTTSYGDTGLKANTKYTYYVIAKDGAGNESGPSGKATVTTKTPQKHAALTGVISGSNTKKPIPHAAVVVNIGSNKHIYQANVRGQYTVRDLEVGRYNVNYRAVGYYSRSFSVKITDTTVITKNVTLQKR
jgi:chitodextrinase